jgi:hypothetical protein
MKKITKRIAIICYALIAVSFNASALDDQKISTFEPGAIGEIGFSSYTVKSTSFFYVQPQVATNTLSGINGSANCITMTTGTTAVRYQTLSFLNLASSITPAMMAARKYMKIMVKRDYNGNKLNILANGTSSNWNTSNFMLSSTTPTINTWVDVVIDLSTAKGTAFWKDSTITNLLIEPVENNSTSLGFRVTVAIDDIVLSDNSTPRIKSSPSISASATNVSSHSYTYGEGSSSEKSFTVNGATLSGDLILTPTAPYEISTTSGSGFTTGSLTLTQSSGTLASTTIYTRLAVGLEASTYNAKNVVITTSGTIANIALSGTVNKANQTITFDALADVKADAADFLPGATSATSAINPITYSSSDELVATIVDGKIHPVAKGTTQITASQASSLNYNAATPVIQNLNVTDTSTDLILSGAEKLTAISSQNNEICIVAHAALKVNIYDINGSMLYSKVLNSSQIEIIPIRKSGVYCVLAIDSTGKSQMYKVLVK